MLVTPTLKLVFHHINCPEPTRGDRDPIFELKHREAGRGVFHCSACSTQVLVEVFERVDAKKRTVQ